MFLYFRPPLFFFSVCLNFFSFSLFFFPICKSGARWCDSGPRKQDLITLLSRCKLLNWLPSYVVLLLYDSLSDEESRVILELRLQYFSCYLLDLFVFPLLLMERVKVFLSRPFTRLLKHPLNPGGNSLVKTAAEDLKTPLRRRRGVQSNPVAS